METENEDLKNFEIEAVLFDEEIGLSQGKEF
jgi:hypothetical protein